LQLVRQGKSVRSRFAGAGRSAGPWYGGVSDDSGRVPAKTQRAYGGPVKPSQAEQIVVIDANRKQRLEE
jgi:hypothetical protein